MSEVQAEMLGTNWIYVWSPEVEAISTQVAWKAVRMDETLRETKVEKSQEPKTEFWDPLMLKGLEDEEEPAKDSAKELSMQQEETPRTSEF